MNHGNEYWAGLNPGIFYITLWGAEKDHHRQPVQWDLGCKQPKYAVTAIELSSSAQMPS